MTPEEVREELKRLARELEFTQTQHRLEMAKVEGRVARLGALLDQRLGPIKTRLEALAVQEHDGETP